MFKQVSFDISNTHIEEFEVQSEISQNRKWPIIWSFQKWKGFRPTSTQYYIIKKASNEILLNMKVVDLSLPFPKCPRSWISNVWLRIYDQIIAKYAWDFKWPYLLNQDSKLSGSSCIVLLLTHTFQIPHHIAWIFITWSFVNPFPFWREIAKFKNGALYGLSTIAIVVKRWF